MNIKTLIDEKEIQDRIKIVADKIQKDYDNEEIVIVCILKGAAFFATELASFNGERKGIDICDILFALSIFFSFAIPCTIFFFLKSNNS